MPHSAPSALITDEGRRVLLRLGGRYFELTQVELRQALGLPPGPLGVGITINRDRLHFEFPKDNQSIELSATQLSRRLTRQSAAS